MAYYAATDSQLYRQVLKLAWSFFLNQGPATLRLRRGVPLVL